MFRALALGLLGSVSGKDHWAVLIAGSKGYWNYRHQADVCHAHHVLVERGFDPDKIITMLFDDVANHSSNPFKGHLYNRPAESMADAVDVYEGCRKDYVGQDVTPEKFLAVLAGDAKTAGGKVLQSTSEDHVFVNFVDHGGVGIIAFPDPAAVLHAKKLVGTLERMHAQGLYGQLVFYLETCESGSMFQGLLPPQLPVYAVTAANAEESSWGTYCGDEAKVGGKSLGTCLGDLFEVNWMSDSEREAPAETLGEQYQRVKKATNKSHVMQYGQVEAFAGEPVADFQGSGGRLGAAPATTAPAGKAVGSRDVKLWLLQEEYLRSSSAVAGERVVTEIRDREAAKALGQAIAAAVAGGREGGTAALAAPLAPAGFEWTPAEADCHERAVGAFGSACGWSENRLVLAKALYQLCRHTLGDPAPIVAALSKVCTPKAEVDLWT